MNVQQRNPRYYNYLELFFKQSQDAISVFDMEDQLISVNPAFERLYGWTLEECIGKKIEFYPETEKEKVQERCKLLKSGISMDPVQVIEKRKDGSYFDAEITMTPIFNEKNEVVAISNITRDISLRLQGEEDAREIERLRTMSEIAAVVAHEVRNPMTAITGFVQLMNHDGANPYASFTKIMEREITRINQIVTDFLVLSEPVLHEQAVFSAAEVMQETINEQAALAPGISFETNEWANWKIFENKVAIKEVFVNIIKNSREAIGCEGVIRISMEVSGNELAVTVEDDGCGMDHAVLQSIYQPFYSTKQNGTGLGMLISKKIIVEHQGTLDVESVQGAWTKVFVTLPLADHPLH